jgi:hypothetical protein
LHLQVDQITYLECSLWSVCISILFHMVLSSEQVCLEGLHHVVLFLKSDLSVRGNVAENRHLMKEWGEDIHRGLQKVSFW